MANGFSGHEWKTIVVLGCGNILFGDDGLRPKVVEFLNESYSIPENTSVIDAACSARSVLFDILLSEKNLRKS